MFNEKEFFVGCNYWASHAATDMWNDWNPDVIKRDLKTLQNIGCQVIRIFPNWRDFQPLRMHYTVKNQPYELRLGEDKLPNTEAGRAGVDELMIERFKFVADLALEYNLKIAVGIITGWMSSKMFVPEAFCGTNLLTDALVLNWQVKFVRYFVKTFKNHPAIIMWGPGNETNCLQDCTREEFNLWSNLITMVIRSEDNTRKIAAGMHGLLPVAQTELLNQYPWSIQAQGEYYDLLTVHPYPEFTPYAKKEPLFAMRNLFHAVAESRMYNDIGKKMCFAEEIGTLSNTWGNEKTKEKYCRSVLANLFAHNCGGFLWWNAFDQTEIKKPPYSWNALERQLGMVTSNGTPKDFTKVINEFEGFLKELELREIPKFKKNACCILSKEQDSWANAWGCFILAKQAKIDIEFAYIDDQIPDYDFYIIPGLNSTIALPLENWDKILNRVRLGATLYISADINFDIVPFDDLIGAEVEFKSFSRTPRIMIYNNINLDLDHYLVRKLNIKNAKVLATDVDNLPIYIMNNYGHGKIYFLDAPLESNLIKTSGLLIDKIKPYYKVYQEFSRTILMGKLIQLENQFLTITEHFHDENFALVLIVNNSLVDEDLAYTINIDWIVTASNSKENIKSNDIVFFKMQRKEKYV